MRATCTCTHNTTQAVCLSGLSPHASAPAWGLPRRGEHNPKVLGGVGLQHADRGPKADRVLKHRMHPSRSPQHRPLRRRPRPRRTGSSSCPSVEPDPHWAVPLSVHAHPGASGERALFCLARRPRRLPRRPPPSTGRRPEGRATTEVQYQDSTWCPARHAGYPKGRLNRLPDGLPTRRWPTRDDGRRGRGKGRSSMFHERPFIDDTLVLHKLGSSVLDFWFGGAVLIRHFRRLFLGRVITGSSVGCRWHVMRKRAISAFCPRPPARLRVIGGWVRLAMQRQVRLL